MGDSWVRFSVKFGNNMRMEEISFRVQGKQYTLSVEQVKEVSAKKPVILLKGRGNEYVIINGKHYNPRNALAVALGLPVKDIPVQDAGKLLARKAWLQTDREKQV